MSPNAGGVANDEVSSQEVPVQAIAMKLLDIRLRPATAIITSVTGEFSAPGSPEIAILKAGGTIELHRIEQSDDEDDPQTSLKLVSRVETRSILRSCALVRFPGEKRDVLSVTADGGALSVLDFENGQCKIVHCSVFGKSGCRRSTPGQYVASDPKGRAVMVSAVEKRKLVYVLNRDAAGKPTIASPLEAHRSRTITFATVGLDNGYDNPIFASLELQYPETEDPSTVTPLNQVEKQLAYYELDLGLNHVSRRWATMATRSACCLAAVPGGADGPGGVLVGGEDWIEYLHESICQNSMEVDDEKAFTKIACAIPRRKLHPVGKGILITNIVLHRQKKSKFFALAQSELGDVYKVTMKLGSEDKARVESMEIALLDTLPTANALNVSKLGMLFASAEFSDHHLYQFERIDIPDAPTLNSDDTRALFLKEQAKNQDMFLTTETANKIAPTFNPTMLKNLRKIYTMDSPTPTTDVMVGELAGNEVSPQIYSLTGRGPRSSIRVMRHGAAVTELAVSDLPGVPGGIFTIPDNSAEAASEGTHNDRFIVVSFADATLVLSVGETVEEVGKESGFLTNAPTLACSALGNDGALCQVHPSGVRQITKGQPMQWHCPGLKRIECACANESQVLIALAGGEVIYFELDPMSGNLTEKVKKDFGADVCCLDVGTIPSGRSRSLFAAVGCRDQTVRIVSLEPGSLLDQRSSSALKSRPHSVALQSTSSTSETGELMLAIGHDDGSSLRAQVDPVTGGIGTSPSRRFLGARPVSVARIELDSSSATLLLSSRPWVGLRDTASGKYTMAPLSYVPLDHGCRFTSDAVKDGIVATAGKTLRILSVDATGMGSGDDEAFNTTSAPLRYTPRQMTLMSNTTEGTRKVVLAVVESDYNEFGEQERARLGFDSNGRTKQSGGEKGDDSMDMDDSDDEGEKDGDAEDNEDADEKQARSTTIQGPVPPSPGHWGSCIRLVDPSNGCKTIDVVELGKNEAALCCASVRFHSKGGEPLLAVGTAVGMVMQPMKQESSSVSLYRIVNGERFQLLHKTVIEDGPILSLAHMQGRLIVGIGNSVRLYEMGKRQLLRKCDLRGLPTCVKKIQTVGDRAFIGDMMQSIQIIRYDAAGNRLALVASDSTPRPIVSQELLDWNTVAIGDKFGNISILRMPRGADSTAVDVTGQRALWGSTRDGAIPKLELLCQYYVGEVVTSMTRSSLVAGGVESLMYVTVTGRLGALVPLNSRDDVEFYTQLEAALRADSPRPTGRDPRAYRSYYAPIMHIVDGDLCDGFNSLSHSEQTKTAEDLDRTVGEIIKKLEDTRNALL